MFFVMQSRRLLAALATGTQCWFTFILLTSTHSSFSSKVLSIHLVPNVYWCLAFFLPRWRIWHLLLLKFMRSLLAHFSRLLRSIWMGAQSSDLSTTSPSFVSSPNSLRVYSDLSSKSLMNILNSTGPSIKPGVYHHSDGLQCHWSQHLEPCSSATFQSASASTYLGHTPSGCLWGCNVLESPAKVKTNNIHYTPFTHQTSHLITEGWRLLTPSPQKPLPVTATFQI